MPIKINDKYCCENVSDITGTALYKYTVLNKMTIYEEIQKDNKVNIIPIYMSDKSYNLNEIELENMKEDELYISNIYCSKRSGFIFIPLDI